VVVREPKLRTGCQSKPVSLASDRELNRYSLLKPAALKPIREVFGRWKRAFSQLASIAALKPGTGPAASGVSLLPGNSSPDDALECPARVTPR